MKSLTVKEERKAYIDISDYDMFTIDRLCGIGLDVEKILSAMDNNNLNYLYGATNNVGAISKDDLEQFSKTFERLVLFVCSNDTLIVK